MTAHAHHIEEALADCVGALQFVLAFYEPGQRHLDTEAWKSACAKGVAAYHKGASAIGWPAIPYEAWNGEVHRTPSLTRRMIAAHASEAAERGEPYNERDGG